MECSDDLFKIDTNVESITFKILHTLEEISGSSDLALVTKPSQGGAQRWRLEAWQGALFCGGGGKHLFLGAGGGSIWTPPA